jgi:hypothetical protein
VLSLRFPNFYVPSSFTFISFSSATLYVAIFLFDFLLVSFSLSSSPFLPSILSYALIFLSFPLPSLPPLLRDVDYDEFEQMLHGLTVSRALIKAAMGFAFDKVESAKEVWTAPPLRPYASTKPSTFPSPTLLTASFPLFIPFSLPSISDLRHLEGLPSGQGNTRGSEDGSAVPALRYPAQLCGTCQARVTLQVRDSCRLTDRQIIQKNSFRFPMIVTHLEETNSRPFSRNQIMRSSLS